MKYVEKSMRLAQWSHQPTMLQGRGTVTNNLVDIIQVIQLGRKSGILTAERGEGNSLETGQVTFVRGNITQARSSSLNGSQALDRLRSWQTCRFTFLPLLQESGPLPTPPQQALRRNSTTRPLTESNPLLPVPTGQPASTTSWGNSHTPQPGATYAPHRLAPPEQGLRYLDQRGV